MNLEALHKAADAFVDAAFDRAGWPTALQLLADAAGATGVLLLPLKGRRIPGVPFTDSVGESVESYFRHGWNERDERFLGVPKLLKTGILVDQDIASPAMIRNSPFYQEFLRPFELQWFAALGFQADHEIWCASIQRNTAQGPFVETEQQALLGIRSQLTTAATLACRFGHARIEGMTAVFQAINTAVVLVDRLGRVVLANAKAEALIRETLPVVKGKFALANPAEQGMLKAQIASALTGQTDTGLTTQEPVIIRRENRQPLVLRVIPIPRKMLNCFTPANIMILITDPEDQPTPPESLLRRLFGLTRTEAALAAALAHGKSLAECADKQGYTLSTARQLAKQVFSKTGTHRQAELVALINSYRLATDRVHS